MDNEIVNQTAVTSAENEDIVLTEKNTYAKPKLIKYGKVTNLTKGGNSSAFDEGGVEPLF